MPLHKNKVIEFIERYPHSSNFSLLVQSRSIAIKPGDPGSGNIPVTPGGSGSTGGTTTPNTPAPVIPGCTVGLSGAQGNPASFTDLETLWLNPNNRYKLNPIGLMRLWAALYRTYYDWVKQALRIYPNPSSSVVKPTRIFLDPTLFTVTYTSAGGDVAVINRGQLGQGALDSFRYFNTSSTTNALTNSYTVSGDGASFVGGPITVLFNYIASIPLYYPALVYTPVQTLNNGRTADRVTPPIGFLTQLLKLGPIKLKLNFNQASNIDYVLIPPREHFSTTFMRLNTDFKIRASYDNQTYTDVLEYGKPYDGPALRWSGTPSINLENNGRGQTDTDVDGNNIRYFRTSKGWYVTYYEPISVTYNTFNLSGTSFVPAAGQTGAYWLKPNIESDLTTAGLKDRTKSIQSQFVQKSTTPIPTVGYRRRVFVPDTTGLTPFKATIKTVDLDNKAQYTNLPSLVVGSAIEGHVKKTYTVRHNATNTDFEAVYEAYYLRKLVDTEVVQGGGKIVGTGTGAGQNGVPVGTTYYTHNVDATYENIISDPDNYTETADYGSFNELRPINSSWSLYDPIRKQYICRGRFTADIFPSKSVRTLEFEFGYNDISTGNFKEYAFAFPIVKGNTTGTTINTIDNSLVNNNYEPNYEDAFWSNYSPEGYAIGDLTFRDAVARDAFALVGSNETNINKWKLMPYTLPISNIFLRSNVANSSLNIRNVSTTFEYGEDYVDNRLIPLPTMEEYEENLAEAAVLGENPVQYWFRKQFNKLLNELIVHCQNTCLKFWKLNYEYSVRNYREYTEKALVYQNETLNVLNLPGTQNVRGKIENPNIETFTLSEGEVDIENSAGPAKLWFLSGGGYVRVDVAQRLLDDVTSLSGVAVST